MHDPDLLRKLHLGEKLTQAEIGTQLGVSQVHAGRLLRKAGLVPHAKSDYLDLPELTPRQHEVLTGSLLGDGSMSATGKHSARFSEGHSLKQEGYLQWKMHELEPFVSSSFPTTKTDRLTGKVFHGAGFATHGCRQLRPYYDSFYGSGKRVFPEVLSGRMTPLVLAIWYMDDGSIANKFHPRISFGLDPVSLERALHALRGMGLESTVHGAGSNRSIEFPGQSDAFFAIVRPHVEAIPCMASKLPLESTRRDQDRNARGLTPEVVETHLSDGLSILEIADQYDVGASTVSRRREAPLRKMGRPVGAHSGGALVESKEAVRDLYEKQGWTDAQIGAHFGVSDALVARHREQWDISTVSVTERVRMSTGTSHHELDEATLRRLYLDVHLTLNEIGVLYGCSKVPVMAKMREWGIPARVGAPRKSR